MQRVTRAVILSRLGDSPELAAGPASLPLLQPNQILVRMEFASVNPQDLATLQGTQQGGRSPPTVPGFEGSGTVIETGSRMKNWRFYGKRVALLASDPSLPGSWSEYVVVSSHYCFPLDDSISFEQGACLFLTPLTVCLFEEMIGKRVKGVVQTNGASNVGKAILRICNFRNIECVHIVTESESLKILQEFGAKHIVAAFDPDYSEKLATLCEEQSVTLGFDCRGGSIAGEILNAMKPDSTLYVYEDNVKFEEITGVDAKSLIFHKKRIAGLNAIPWFAKKNSIQKLALLRHIQSMNFLYKSEIVGTFPIDEAANAVEAARRTGCRGKVLLQLHAILTCRTGMTQGPEVGEAVEEKKEEEEERHSAEEAAPHDPEVVDEHDNIKIPAIPQLPDIKSMSHQDAEDGDESI